MLYLHYDSIETVAVHEDHIMILTKEQPWNEKAKNLTILLKVIGVVYSICEAICSQGWLRWSETSLMMNDAENFLKTISMMNEAEHVLKTIE